MQVSYLYVSFFFLSEDDFKYSREYNLRFVCYFMYMSVLNFLDFIYDSSFVNFLVSVCDGEMQGQSIPL